MNDAEIARLIDYLRNVKKWTDTEIVELIRYITTGKTE